MDMENQIEHKRDEIPWYLIDSDGTFCFLWNFGITIVTIYTLIVSPFVYVTIFKFSYMYILLSLVFQDQYQVWHTEDDGKTWTEIYRNSRMIEREYIVDIIYCVEIFLNFFKRSNAYNDLKKIALNYLK